MANETKSVRCGRCKYVTDVPVDLHEEFNPRDCIRIQCGSQPDAVCKQYLAPLPANRPFVRVQRF